MKHTIHGSQYFKGELAVYVDNVLHRCYYNKQKAVAAARMFTCHGYAAHIENEFGERHEVEAYVKIQEEWEGEHFPYEILCLL